MRPDPNPTSQHGHVRWLFCLGKKDTYGLLAVNAGSYLACIPCCEGLRCRTC